MVVVCTSRSEFLTQRSRLFTQFAVVSTFSLCKVTSTVSGKLWRSDLVQNGCHVNKLVKLQENICLCALISKFLVSKLIESSSKYIKELSDIEVGANCA